MCLRSNTHACVRTCVFVCEYMCVCICVCPYLFVCGLLHLGGGCTFVHVYMLVRACVGAPACQHVYVACGLRCCVCKREDSPQACTAAGAACQGTEFCGTAPLAIYPYIFPLHMTPCSCRHARKQADPLPTLRHTRQHLTLRLQAKERGRCPCGVPHPSDT